MSTEPISTYSIPGTRINVYPNRLEIKTSGCSFGRRQTILFRNIASIEKPAMLNCIDIHTNDNKKFRIALSPSDTKKLKEQLESLL